MVIVDQTAPADIVDRLLWQDAQQLLGCHEEAGPDGNCVWCGWRWPCAPRRLAERAELASRRPWREAWTLRHDLNSIRAMPGLRAENRGAFPQQQAQDVVRKLDRPPASPG